MANKALKAQKNGALFIQPDGPNTQPFYLGCYNVDEITEELGSINLLQCFDEFGNYITAGFTEEAPAPIDVALGTFTGKRFEFLDNLRKKGCSFGLYMHLRECKRADLFTNFVRSAILDIAKVTSVGRTDWIRQNENGDGAMSSYGAQALPPILEVVKLRGLDQSTSETEALNNIVFCNDPECGGACGPAQELCESGFITSDAQAGSPSNEANVLETSSSGTTWTAAATNPFGAGEDIVGATCFPLDADTTRQMVARGTTDAGQGAEIAYSDDGGATWTNVVVAVAPVADFAADSDALFALDSNNIWFATALGYIYKSEDGGATWTAQESAVITSQYNGIYFRDAFEGMAIGDGDIVAITIDGGDTWSAATATGSGSDLLSIKYNGLFWWVGTDAGELFFSIDQGTTWTERTGWTGSGTGTIDAIDFANKYVGLIAHNVGGAGSVLHTIDGGFTWTIVTMSTNTGINDIFMCDENLAYAVGEVQAGTGYIAKIQSASGS